MPRYFISLLMARRYVAAASAALHAAIISAAMLRRFMPRRLRRATNCRYGACAAASLPRRACLLPFSIAAAARCMYRVLYAYQHSHCCRFRYARALRLIFLRHRYLLCRR